MVSSPGSDWAGVPVLVTGHTGFKGSWLAVWLSDLGASVHGYALSPPTDPAVFDVARLHEVIRTDTRADLADRGALRLAMAKAAPRVVFHLAAQSLVRVAYEDPAGTFATNVMGTVNLLEAVRESASVEAVVVVTTDKVYENREWVHPYREADRLGGHDPYSASKAAAEIAVASYRASFFDGKAGAAKAATARAGNVVGGGDWARDRLVPDCLRAFAAGLPVRLRYPHSVRPWQHVLDPICGYVRLAEALMGSGGREYAHAWNFGPDAAADAEVHEVAESVARLWGGEARVECDTAADNPAEAGLLRLDATMARTQLAWRPRWDLSRALAETVAWHRAWLAGSDMLAETIRQIRAYRQGGTA